MKVEVQFTADCPNAPALLQRAKRLANERSDVTLLVTQLEGDVAPEGFAGSPTILIDGSNPFGGTPTAHAACALHPPTPDQLEAVLESR
jgi:hypothetical protein